MFKQATVQDIKRRAINKLHGKVVVITRYYPRYLKRRLIDEYLSILAPSLELLNDFIENEDAVGDHNLALERIDYEGRFRIAPEALQVLKELTTESETNAVYLVCHCKIGQRCHRELILLIAQEFCGAKIPKLSFGWENFRARIASRDIFVR